MNKLFGVFAVAGLLAGCAQRADHTAAIARGHHLATVMGCTSCHGKALDGHLFEENAQFALVWSSNLSRILPGWSDRQIETALRTGKRPNGVALWFMPTFAQRELSRGDMAALIAWLRLVPPSGSDHPPIRPGPQFAEAVSQGFSDSAAMALRLAKRIPVDVGSAHVRGRYLATIACAECHGPDLTGPRIPAPGEPPDLAIAAAYTPKAFARLLKTGVAQSGAPAGEMAEEARKRLSALDPGEVEAIRRYLVARAKAGSVNGSER